MSNIAVIAGVIALGILAGCVTVLAWHGTVDGQAVIGFFTGLTVSGLIGVSNHVATRNGARAALKKEDA